MARREPSEQATLDDVARVAGVSRATAARVLGGYGSASADARERVLAAADALRYRPNALARSIRVGSTGTVGVVVSDIQLAFFSQAVRGIADAAHAEGFEVILANTDELLAAERAAVGVLVDKRVDGMIVVPADPTDISHLQEAQDRGIPIVLFDRGAPDLRCDVVVVDNTSAVRNAVRHLVRLGHRRVAIVVEDKSSIAADDLATTRLGPGSGMTSPLREIGWAAALREAKLPLTDDLILRARYERSDACRVTATALAMADRPTALVTTDEAMTLGALDAILQAGLEMPRDVSLIGFDDLPWTSIIRPALSAIAQPVHEIGVTAAQRLLRRIAGFDGPPETVILRTTFMLRDSTGPAPA
jgi:LacI family transcriptional regulator, galactose operon repressor